MIAITLRKAALNPDRLHADLAAALGKAFLGLSHAGETLTLHLTDDAAPALRDQASALALAHDAAARTPDQQAQADRDALPFFRLDADQLADLAATMDAAQFRREMARAFAYLRDCQT